MQKLKYFGSIIVFFMVALLIANNFDRNRAKELTASRLAECSREITAWETNFIDSLSALFSDQLELQRLRQKYESEGSNRLELFTRIEMLGNTLISKADVNNPAVRKLVDQAFGALNRRSVVLKDCT